MKKIVPAVILVLGIVLALTPFVLWPVCSTLTPAGSHMKCWYSAVFITAMGAVAAMAALGALRGRPASLWYAVSVAAAALSWLVPKGIVKVACDGWACGLCGKAMMACNSVTMPHVALVAGAIVVLGVVGLLLSFVSEGR